MSENKRPFSVGVLASGFCCAGLVTIGSMGGAEHRFVGLLVIGVISFLMASLASAILGIPFAIWLLRRKKLSVVPLCIAGALVGAILLAGINGWSNYWPEMNDRSHAVSIAVGSAARTALPGAVIGLLCAAAFCLGSGIPVVTRSGESRRKRG